MRASSVMQVTAQQVWHQPLAARRRGVRLAALAEAATAETGTKEGQTYEVRGSAIILCPIPPRFLSNCVSRSVCNYVLLKHSPIGAGEH